MTKTINLDISDKSVVKRITVGEYTYQRVDGVKELRYYLEQNKEFYIKDLDYFNTWDLLENLNINTIKEYEHVDGLLRYLDKSQLYVKV